MITKHGKRAINFAVEVLATRDHVNILCGRINCAEQQVETLEKQLNEKQQYLNELREKKILAKGNFFDLSQRIEEYPK